MGRMIGSTSAHEAMNARMTATMGSQAESRMHQVLGNPSDWNWMTGSPWKTMSPADWQSVQPRLLGTTHSAGGGWDSRDVVLLAVAVALAAGIIGLLFARRPWQRSRT